MKQNILRALSVLLAVMIMVSITACTQKLPDKSNTTTTAPSTTTTTTQLQQGMDNADGDTEGDLVLDPDDGGMVILPSDPDDSDDFDIIIDDDTASTVTDAAVLLSGFETQADLNAMAAVSNFGKRQLNTNKTYVTQGNSSLYLEVHSGRALDYSPPVGNRQNSCVDMVIESLNHSNDYSHTVSFTFDAYNASDRDAEVRMVLTGGIGGATYQIDLGIQYLPKGRWTKLKFDNDLSRNINLGVDSVRSMRLYFPMLTADQTPIKVYLDNFTAHDRENVEYLNRTSPGQQGDVLCGFEDLYFYNNSYIAYETTMQVQPVISQNRDSRFVTEGDYSLRIKRFSKYEPEARWSGYRMLFMPLADMVATIDFNKYPVETTKIMVDVYSDAAEEMSFTMTIGGYDGTVAHSVNVLKPKQWNTIEIPLNMASVDKWKTAESVYATFYDFFGTSNASIYIDNIRLIQG